jgi:hypothetical protein
MSIDDVAPPPFTCPKCGRTSHNPNDAKWCYCGVCGFIDRRNDPGMAGRNATLDALMKPRDESRPLPWIVVENELRPGESFVCWDLRTGKQKVMGISPTDESYERTTFIAEHSILPCNVPHALAVKLAEAWNNFNDWKV